jgi:succinate dehydrogenase/fumarate reductase flavoprotein subunit
MYEDTFVRELIQNQGVVCGVRALDLKDGKEHLLYANAVILCTGGLLHIHQFGPGLEGQRGWR